MHIALTQQKLASEIRIWAKLNHEFVLPLLGFFVEGENMMPALISEWMERGTLHDIMRNFPRGGIDALIMVRRVRILSQSIIILVRQLRDIASGLAYLHFNHVIHADLKSVSRTFLTSMITSNLFLFFL